VQHPQAAEQQFLPHALPAPAQAPTTWRGPLAWAAGAAAVLLAGAWIAGAIADTVPIADRAVVNGRLHPIQARIAGTLELRQLAPGSRIDAGAAIGRITNAEVDRIRLDALGIKAQAVATRIDTLSAQLRAAQSERERRAAERPAATTATVPAAAPEAAGQAELRAQLAAAAAALDEALAARIAELQAQLADQRQAQTTALADIATEQQRIEQLRSAEVVADIGGVVWRAERNGTVAAGREVAALLVPETLVLDAELPAGTDAAPGHRARVRFGGAVVDAVVEQVDPGAAELAGYALPAGRGGGRRVLLRVDDPRDLERAFAAPARVALLGSDPGQWRLWIAGLRL
jgi:multidrug resistance efflux pump